MEDLIKDIMRIHTAADNAFSYNAMSFDKRMDAINEWNRLLRPENVMMMLNTLKEKDGEIENLTEEIDRLQEEIEEIKSENE